MAVLDVSPADLARLRQIGVTEDLVSAARIRRVTDEEARLLYGMCFSGDLSGIVFPYHDPVTGDRVTARLRRDSPELDSEGKPTNKYISAFGDNRHLYFPPGARDLINDVSVPLVFVEAEKSALAVTALAARSGQKLLAIAAGNALGRRVQFPYGMPLSANAYIIVFGPSGDALKLAMTYAALEDTLPVITSNQLAAAIQVAAYAQDCARCLIEARFSGANVMRELENRIRACVTRGPQNTTTKRHLHRALARHFHNSEQFNRAFDAMVRAGSLYIKQGEHGRLYVSTEPLA